MTPNVPCIKQASFRKWWHEPHNAWTLIRFPLQDEEGLSKVLCAHGVLRSLGTSMGTIVQEHQEGVKNLLCRMNLVVSNLCHVTAPLTQEIITNLATRGQSQQ